MLQSLIVFLLYLVKDASMYCEADDQYSWSYHGPNNDPSHWGDFYPDCNESTSPLQINDTDIDTFQKNYLVFNGFDQPITKAKVQNLGWTVKITPEDDVERMIRFGNYNFTLEEIRFHFGTESDPGAENIINGVRYPMEIQYYMGEASGPYSFFSSILSTHMNIDEENNSAFNPIVDVLPDVLYRNDYTELPSDLNLNDLLPKMTRDTYYYYTYIAYKSIPPCYPFYNWWILKDVGKIGKDQLDTFMTLYSVGKDDASDDCRMGPNYKPASVIDDDLLIGIGPYNN